MPSVLELLDRPHLGRYAPYKRRDAVERIADLVDITEDDCWLWNGRLNNSGYGQMGFAQAGYQAVTLSAHRVSYELHNGPVPAGLVLDHLCRNRHCVNPDHLEPVTSRENVMRSPIAPASINARKTHCPQGHEYTTDNIYVSRVSGRLCRTCQTARNRDQAVWA